MLAFIPPVFALTVFMAILVLANPEGQGMNQAIDDSVTAMQTQFNQIDAVVQGQKGNFPSLTSGGPNSVQDVTSFFEMPYPYTVTDEDVLFYLARIDGEVYLTIFVAGELTDGIQETGLSPQATRMLSSLKRNFPGALVDSGVVQRASESGGEPRVRIGEQVFRDPVAGSNSPSVVGDIGLVVEIDI